ncbi:hypothetical protein [Pontibacter kalidii]|uniref:hypothetical protein n=1 Tax=Pontibacter kalidii TaxID=2592049 RepID=UPI00225B5861|nr:hypothetical protein [Pontibacter kalidii]
MFSRQLVFLFILSIATLSASCQDSKDKDESGLNPIDNRLVGKWDVRSKTDTEKVKGAEKETDRDVYQPGEKTYEFTAANKLIITDGFGRKQTTLPVWMVEGKLYIGQYHQNKVPYTITFTENGLRLVKEEESHEDGEITMQQEVVVLERAR